MDKFTNILGDKNAQTSAFQSFADKFSPKKTTTSTTTQQSPIYTGTPTPFLTPKVDTSPTPVASLMTPKPTVAPVTTQTAQNQLGVTANNAIAQAQAAQTAQATTPPVSGREKALEDILKLSQKQGEKGQRNLDLQKETGLTKKQEELNKINAEAITLSAAYDKQIKDLQKNPEGKLTAQLNNEINQLSRQKNSELADIATRQAVAQGNVELANKIIEQKLDAEFEPIQNQIDSLKSYYSLAGDDLTSSEKAKLQEQIDERQREKDYQYDLKLMNAKQALETSSANTNLLGTVGDNGKPLTAEQATAYGYGQRLAEADKIISNKGSSFTGVASIVGQNLPNVLKTTERQQFEQAQRNFINAVLRKESGAVISPEEFENARQQYFPVVGDSADTLAQKSANRQTVIQNMFRSANSLTRYAELNVENLSNEELLSKTVSEAQKSFNNADFFNSLMPQNR